MKKLLRQNLHKLKYAFIVVSVQCFLVEVAWATGNNVLNKSAENINMFAEKFYFQSPQQQRVITGKVVSSEDNQGIPGVTVRVKDTSIGVATDFNGNFTLEVPSQDAVLVFSAIGFVTEELAVGSQREINVSLTPDIQSLKEVVVVGYGEQRKETVVGAVTQTNAEVLQRTGGVSNVGQAMTGNLPGLVTNSSSGMPGDENPQIFIRGQSSWNNAQPLILVDGVERPEFFTTMDVGSVESISVLKDASATAVFGSRGANGVVIITTKRGRLGKAEITARANSTAKVVSKLPGKYNAYDAIGVRNRAIEYELSLNPDSWGDIIPEEIRNKYANPANAEEAARYTNVDWQNEMFKDYAMAYNANVGVRGGTEFVKYFANIDYQKEGDLFRDFDNSRGYNPGYDYNRLNFRSNLDFQLTPTTKLQTDLGGTYGVRQHTWNVLNEFNMWGAAYNNPPDVFLPEYADGTWGYYRPDEQTALNSIRILSLSGVEKTTTTRLSTNFVLQQELDMLLKGLNFRGSLSLDNTFVEGDRGVDDLYNNAQEKWINPETGEELYKYPIAGTTRFDYYNGGPAWQTRGGELLNNDTQRKLFYQLQLNYAGTVAEKHNYSLMGLMNRLQDAKGSIIPIYREDWVFRTTYNYKNKYMVEYNGAYNGSEAFSEGYRFAFFSSGGLGWMISEENFMDAVPFIDMLKLRASYGEVGSDNVLGDPYRPENRFLYLDQWAYGGNSKLGLVNEGSEYSPYTWYRPTAVGNPNVRWETAYKYNLGLDFGLLDGLIEGSVDVFRENRKDILVTERAIPAYFGAEAPAANLGRVQSQGYEIALGINHTFGNGIGVWADFAMTHAENEVLERDDPTLLEAYQKDQGYQIGQARTQIGAGYYNNWDELYASTVHNANDQNKIPGNYQILDINGDGVIDSFDSAPFGYSGVPQNTYNTNLGIKWKGFNAFVQFYGVNNVTRQVVFTSLSGRTNRVYEQGSFWSKDEPDADTPMPRWLSQTAGYNYGNRFFYDGSYLRVKNAEIAYNFTQGLVKRMGLQALRVFANGNNLFLWTEMPDDRESNFAGTGWASQGAYPTVRRYNLGLNVTF